MESYNKIASQIRRRAFFLSTPAGERFCLLTRPHGRTAGILLYLHPFAEEMNKSRRMAALAARAYAAEGWATLQIDLHGCGDSAGDFRDAEWQGWLDDVSRAVDWLRDECAGGPLALWALRGGALLAADWLRRSNEDLPLILWQPVGSGRQHLTQFLRLRAASEMLGSSRSAGILSQLREALEAGQPVEIAGYELSPGLASGLGAAELRVPVGYQSRVEILEVVGARQDALSPATSVLVRRLESAGAAVSARAVQGPGFWQTLEIETAPRLIDASLECIKSLEP